MLCFKNSVAIDQKMIDFQSFLDIVGKRLSEIKNISMNADVQVSGSECQIQSTKLAVYRKAKFCANLHITPILCKLQGR